MKPLVLIANPVARLASDKRIQKAVDLFRSEGYEVTVSFTGKKGDAEELARKASQNGASLLIIAGGDGTINEAANGIVHTDLPMAILPMGTTNVLAKELGIPEDVEGAVSNALKGKPHTVSLGKITVEHPSRATRYFCLMAGIGFDGETVYGFSQTAKRFSGKAAYILSGLKTLLRYSPQPLTFSVSGKKYEGYSAIIGKASKYGGNFMVTPDASLLRPELYACIMQGKRRLDILRYVSGVVTGRHLGIKDIRYMKAMSLKVEGCAHVQIDGDYLGKTPAEIAVVPDALKLIF